jgi:hypothetical protein
MSKLLLMALCVGVMLIVSNGAYAKGSPVVFHSAAEDSKFASTTPPVQRAVIRRHPHKHHLTHTH